MEDRVERIELKMLDVNSVLNSINASLSSMSETFVSIKEFQIESQVRWEAEVKSKDEEKG